MAQEAELNLGYFFSKRGCGISGSMWIGGRKEGELCFDFF